MVSDTVVVGHIGQSEDVEVSSLCDVVVGVIVVGVIVDNFFGG